MKPLVLFGNGDIARLAHYYFSKDSPYTVGGFVVDVEYATVDEFLGLPLVSTEQLLERFPPDEFAAFVAVSYARMNVLRAERYLQLKSMGYEMTSYVSSRCTYLAEERPGENCFILEDNTVQPFVSIGNNVTLWSGNHIGHDSVVEDHCFISSHVVVSGHVRVGSYSFLGVNSTIAHQVTIGHRTLVGAGAVITKDTDEGAVYAPARSVALPMTSDRARL